MPITGNAEPAIEKLSTAQSEHTLIDIRNDGMSPKANIPNPCDDKTVANPSMAMRMMPPGWGKPSTPKT